MMQSDFSREKQKFEFFIKKYDFNSLEYKCQKAFSEDDVEEIKSAYTQLQELNTKIDPKEDKKYLPSALAPKIDQYARTRDYFAANLKKTINLKEKKFNFLYKKAEKEDLQTNIELLMNVSKDYSDLSKLIPANPNQTITDYAKFSRKIGKIEDDLDGLVNEYKNDEKDLKIIKVEVKKLKSDIDSEVKDQKTWFKIPTACKYENLTLKRLENELKNNSVKKLKDIKQTLKIRIDHITGLFTELESKQVRDWKNPLEILEQVQERTKDEKITDRIYYENILKEYVKTITFLHKKLPEKYKIFQVYLDEKKEKQCEQEKENRLRQKTLIEKSLLRKKQAEQKHEREIEKLKTYERIEKTKLLRDIDFNTKERGKINQKIESVDDKIVSNQKSIVLVEKTFKRETRNITNIVSQSSQQMQKAVENIGMSVEEQLRRVNEKLTKIESQPAVVQTNVINTFILSYEDQLKKQKSSSGMLLLLKDIMLAMCSYPEKALKLCEAVDVLKIVSNSRDLRYLNSVRNLSFDIFKRENLQENRLVKKAFIQLDDYIHKCEKRAFN